VIGKTAGQAIDSLLLNRERCTYIRRGISPPVERIKLVIIVDNTGRVRCRDIRGRCRAFGTAFDSGGAVGPMRENLLKVMFLKENT